MGYARHTEGWARHTEGWARFEKDRQLVPHDLLNSTGFHTGGDLKYFPLIIHLWMYCKQNSFCATRALVLLFAGRISLSHLRQPAEHCSKTQSPDQGQASGTATSGEEKKNIPRP